MAGLADFLSAWDETASFSDNRLSNLDVLEIRITAISDEADLPAAMELVVESDVLLNASLRLQAEEQIEQTTGVPVCRLICEPADQIATAEEIAILTAENSAWLVRHMSRLYPIEGSILERATLLAEGRRLIVRLDELSLGMLGSEPAHWIREALPFASAESLTISFRSDGEPLPVLSSGQDHRREELSRAADALSSRQKNNGDSKPGSTGSAEAGFARISRDQAGFRRSKRRTKSLPGCFWGRIDAALIRTDMRDLTPDSGLVLLQGDLFNLYIRDISNGTRKLIKFGLTDGTGSISCTIYAKPEDAALLEEKLPGGCLQVAANVFFDDRYEKDLQAQVLGVKDAERLPVRQDRALRKRVELHAHTKMSARDGLADTAELIRKAEAFGHPAVAITDHGVVQAFPDAAATRAALRKNNQSIKIIYGLEGYLVEDGPVIVHACAKDSPLQGFVALDVETTGLDPAVDRLIEVAAIRYQRSDDGGFEAMEQLVTLIDPELPIPEMTVRLTGINDAMVTDQPKAHSVLQELRSFIGDWPVVAHNALFDLNFLRQEGFRTTPDHEPRLKFNPQLIDTLPFARLMLPDLANHRLATIAEALGLDSAGGHRAEADARLCAAIFIDLWRRSGAQTLIELNRRAGWFGEAEARERKAETYHIVLLAANDLGLYHLYRLVSLAHLDHFYYRPRIPRSALHYFRSGLIVGAACEQGEVFQAVRQLYRTHDGDLAQARSGLSDPELLRTARFYDYLEIQPIGNNAFYLRDVDSGLRSEADLRAINQLIADLGSQIKRPVCATADAHYLEPEDGIYRKILLSDEGFEDADLAPDLYFRTTEEMLDEFSYLGEQMAEAVVIDHPNAIAARVADDLLPFPDGSFPPLMDSAADEVRRICAVRAQELYGREGVLPDLVADRLDRELNVIIGHGFAIMYYIAHELVRQSREDGYPVGSRGSVGSSLAATLCDITEVNPLPPHYRCPNCRLAQFDDLGTYASGYDLPPRICPECGTPMVGDGQNIPFETFLGFDGDKQPDIDLNFSGEYQARAHRKIEEMFGTSHTFRAGTISGFAQKNAFNAVEKYMEQSGLTVTRAEIGRLAGGLIGVKRTTGQHPGGIVVVPQDREVYDFTPVQHPADKREKGTVTTHFDFNALHETILKLDILGHDDPSMLKMLGDVTGVDIDQIPIPDPEVMSLFRSADALRGQGSCPAEAATIGIPEMGTFMAREMIREIQPRQFYDLVQMMGLSHGTDVWKGNARELIRQGICRSDEVIGCRDNIMTGLIAAGVPAKLAFDIVERVRKGRGLTEEQELLMRQKEVPDWYIDSCKKIRYLFPKAHAVAYVISSLRIAWFKINYPEAYYCAYFTIRADEFDAALMCQPPEVIRRNKNDMLQQVRAGNDRKLPHYYILELVEEMQWRGISFLPPDIHLSDATRFLIEAPGQIRPPLNAIDQVSTAIAGQIVLAREQGQFQNRDELRERARIGPSVLDSLAAAGCLGDLPESRQIDIFELLGGAEG